MSVECLSIGTTKEAGHGAEWSWVSQMPTKLRGATAQFVPAIGKVVHVGGSTVN